MKAMGLEQLWLVAPSRFPSAEATARAAGADDILHEARIVESVDEALAGCGLVIGTTARMRRIEWPVIDAREGACRSVAQAVETPVSVLFGRERSGLTNAEVDKCHALIRIPVSAQFSSLNVAAAVQILAYEMRLAAYGRSVAVAVPSGPAATADELEGFYRHLEDTLVRVGYLDPAKPKLLMRRLRRLFNRAGPDRAEINILRGILTAADRSATGGPGGRALPAPVSRQPEGDAPNEASG